MCSRVSLIIVTGLATAHVMLIMRVHCSCNRPRIVARSASEAVVLTQWLVTSVLSHRIRQKPTDCKVWWRFIIREACGDKERSNLAFSGNPLLCVPLTPPVKSLSTCSGSQT